MTKSITQQIDGQTSKQPVNWMGGPKIYNWGNNNIKKLKGGIFTHCFSKSKAQGTFITFHLGPPMPRKLFNSIKE